MRFFVAAIASFLLTEMCLAGAFSSQGMTLGGVGQLASSAERIAPIAGDALGWAAVWHEEKAVTEEHDSVPQAAAPSSGGSSASPVVPPAPLHAAAPTSPPLHEDALDTPVIQKNEEPVSVEPVPELPQPPPAPLRVVQDFLATRAQPVSPSPESSSIDEELDEVSTPEKKYQAAATIVDVPLRSSAIARTEALELLWLLFLLAILLFTAHKVARYAHERRQH